MKIHCEQCRAELEVEASALGTAALCPVCGLKTMLFRQDDLAKREAALWRWVMTTIWLLSAIFTLA